MTGDDGDRTDEPYEEQLARWARFVHNDPLQELSAVGIRLQLLRNDVEDGARADVDELLASVRATAQQLRTLQFELHPNAFDEDDLPGALRDLAAHRAGDRGTHHFVDAPVPAVEAAALHAVFRSAQQLLDLGARRGAGGVGMLLAPDPEGVRLTLEIADGPDGHPFDLDDATAAALRRRLEAVGGTFRHERDDGFTCHLRVPAAG